MKGLNGEFFLAGLFVGIADLKLRPGRPTLVAAENLMVEHQRLAVLFQRPMTRGHLPIIRGEIVAQTIGDDRLFELAELPVGRGDLPLPCVGVLEVAFDQSLINLKRLGQFSRSPIDVGDLRFPCREFLFVQRDQLAIDVDGKIPLLLFVVHPGDVAQAVGFVGEPPIRDPGFVTATLRTQPSGDSAENVVGHAELLDHLVVHLGNFLRAIRPAVDVGGVEPKLPEIEI